MSETSVTPWSNHPNAPQIPSWLYRGEKKSLAGMLIGAISYGIVVALFFQCMATLLSPTNPIRKGIRWAFVAHTVALFSFLTIPVAIDFNHLSIEYINNREFPGNDEYPPGPLGYDNLLAPEATATVFNTMFPFNQWLADGLLLHRCYIIYSMNHRVMAFPYLMYLASVALGITRIYYNSGMRYFTVTQSTIATSYYSVCLSLNVLLTLMIVVRLMANVRNIRKATGASGGSSELHTVTATVVTMLIESYALYAIVLLSYVISWAVQNWIVAIFSKSVGKIQVIAPYLIILRVAKRRALTSKSISGTAESIHFRSQWSTDGGESLPDEDSVSAAGANVEAPVEPGSGNENVIEGVPS